MKRIQTFTAHHPFYEKNTFTVNTPYFQLIIYKLVRNQQNAKENDVKSILNMQIKS